MSAYVRFYQPETSTSALTQSSYLRLGAYSSTDESSLVTNLTTTTSSDSTSSVTAISQAHSTPNPDSSSGQDTATVSDSVTSTYTTANNGLLAYTFQDFQANVAGAALMKIGNGHTTEVTAGDALYKVDQGGYTIEANNDIVISAGFNGAPANLELKASDYIKETAGGPLSRTIFGNADSQTVGNTADFYLGTKFSCMIGSETSLNLDISLTLSFEYEISIAIGGAVGVNIGFDNSLILGNQIAIQEGIYFKQVTGSYINLVIGNDVKTAATSMKILDTTDFKIAPTSDLKQVGLNGTWCSTDVKITAAEIREGKINAKQSNLMARIDQLESRSGAFQAKTIDSVLYM